METNCLTDVHLTLPVTFVLHLTLSFDPDLEVQKTEYCIVFQICRQIATEAVRKARGKYLRNQHVLDLSRVTDLAVNLEGQRPLVRSRARWLGNWFYRF